MKKVLLLVAVLVACAFVPMVIAEAAEETDGAEMDVWYYYYGVAPAGDQSIVKLARMDKVETTWPNCEFTLTDVPDLSVFENFTFSHWSVWVHTSYDIYLLGDYSNDEIQGLTISYTPEKQYEVPYLFYVEAIYDYTGSGSGSEKNGIPPYLFLLIGIILIFGAAVVFSRIAG